MRALLLLLVLAGCGSNAASSPPVPADPRPPPSTAPVAAPSTPPSGLPPAAAPSIATTAMDGDLEWQLVAPTSITMADRAGWTLTTQATNRGTGSADAMHGFGSFTINGAPSMELDMAFGNGLAPTSWSALAPGETADPSRSGFGESLFPTPGDYEIVMTRGAAVVGITVHVLAPTGPTLPAVTS